MSAGIRFLVDVSYVVGAAAYLPVLAYQAVRFKKHRTGWGERFARLPRQPKRGPRVWVHAVSMGEVNAARGLVEALGERVPEADFIITTTTDTGYARAKAIYPKHAVHRYPLDFGWVVRRALDVLQPDLIVLIELEVWYNLVTCAAARGIPVCVVNGRLSERSASRFGWIRPVVRQMFSALTWVGAQDEVYAGRFREVGVAADRVEVTGSLKWDTAGVADHVDGTAELAAALGIDTGRRLWIGGSTGDREEAFLLDAHKKLKADFPDLQLAIIPRKPERFDEVAQVIGQRGWPLVRRSQVPDGGSAEPPADAVFLGDTMGEIRKFYELGDVVFVGRTLNGWGGSDPMEVAALQRPIVIGPHTKNFQDAVDRLAANNALKSIDGPEQLAESVGGLLADRSGALAMAQRARQTVIENQGATDRSAERLTTFLKSRLERSA